MVNVDQNLLSAGNTFTFERPVAVAGRSITMEDQVVNRDSLGLPPPMVPGFLPNRHRFVIEIAAGANATAIQQAIDTAAGMNGTRPVIHLPTGNFLVDHTLVIPAGCDLQLVGDGFGDGFLSRGTRLQWAGPPGDPLLHLVGPSRATLRELAIYGGGIVIDNCDQVGARVFMESVYPSRSGVNLLVDRLDNTDVSMHDLEHGGANDVSVRVIGGAAQAAGQTTRGRVDLFGGQSGGGNLTYQVEHGGRLLVEDCWFEAGPGFMRLTDSGTFTLNNAQIAPGDEAHTRGGTNGEVAINDFHGQVAFLNTYFTQTGALVKGDGSATDLLLLGCAGFHLTDAPWLINQSPNATVQQFFTQSSVITGPGAYNTYALPDLGDADPVFLRKMLSQVRSETPRKLVPLSPEVTDVRLFRVSVELCRVGIKLTGTNAPPQLVPMPTQFVISESSTLTLTNQVTDPDLPFDSFTFMLGPGAPAGMNLNPTNGVLTWTPIEAEGPSTNTLQVIIGDDGSPRLFVTNTLIITVLESNLPPSLGVAGIVTNVVLENFVNIADPASSSRLPPSWNSLGNGDFTLIADGYQFQGFDDGAFAYQRVSGDFDVSVRLASMEALRPETTAGLMVRETLDAYSRTLHVLARPAGVTQDGRVGAGYFFTLQRAVAGETDDRWDSGYGGGTVTLPHAWMRLRRRSQTFTAYWSDDGVNWTQVGQHTVTPAYPQDIYVGLAVTSGYNSVNAHFEFRSYRNLVSTLVSIPDAAVNEGAPISYQVVAADADLPRQTLTFSLVPGAPAEAAIDPATGIFTWTPSEAQGPGTHPITVRVTDNDSPPLSATQTFMVNVSEVNTAPVLTPIPTQTVNEGSALSFLVTATDADLPAQTLSFSLVAGPADVSLDAITGLLAWTPTAAQTPSTNTITVRVTDDGPPPLSNTNTFTVIVQKPQILAPQVLNPTISGNTFRVSTPTVSGRNYVLEFKSSLTDSNWTRLPALIGDGTVKTLTDPAATGQQRYYRVRVE